MMTGFAARGADGCADAPTPAIASYDGGGEGNGKRRDVTVLAGDDRRVA